MKNRLSILILLAISNISISQNTILRKVTDSLNNKTSYIVGTLHQMGDSFIDSIPEVEQHLYNSELVIFESIDVVDKTVKSINDREVAITVNKELKKDEKNFGFNVEPIELNLDSNSINTKEMENKLQTLLDSTYQANKEAVGIMIHVESPDKKLSWSSAVGFSNKETKEVLNKNQPVLIASNTKTFVAATILKLVEGNELKLNQPIKNIVHKKTRILLEKSGYDLNTITVKHLLSHTSGITDYVEDSYFLFVKENPNHKWTRDEQIELAMKRAKPIEAGKSFAYGDINYLLLTEIIESKTRKPFYTAIRDLLELDTHHINNTWFVNLETKPINAPTLAHQYAKKYNWDSYDLNPSWDLYGGGGLVSTTKDLAFFFQLLFEGKIIKDKAILKSMYTLVLPNSIYCLGIRRINFFRETIAYYHGGWWGTDVMYLPEYNTTISVFTLNREKRELNAQISHQIIKLLKK